MLICKDDMCNWDVEDVNTTDDNDCFKIELGNESEDDVPSYYRYMNNDIDSSELFAFDDMDFIDDEISELNGSDEDLADDNDDYDEDDELDQDDNDDDDDDDDSDIFEDIDDGEEIDDSDDEGGDIDDDVIENNEEVEADDDIENNEEVTADDVSHDNDDDDELNVLDVEYIEKEINSVSLDDIVEDNEKSDGLYTENNNVNVKFEEYEDINIEDVTNSNFMDVIANGKSDISVYTSTNGYYNETEHDTTIEQTCEEVIDTELQSNENITNSVKLEMLCEIETPKNVILYARSDLGFKISDVSTGDIFLNTYQPENYHLPQITSVHGFIENTVSNDQVSNDEMQYSEENGTEKLGEVDNITVEPENNTVNVDDTSGEASISEIVNPICTLSDREIINHLMPFVMPGLIKISISGSHLLPKGIYPSNESYYYEYTSFHNFCMLQPGRFNSLKNQVEKNTSSRIPFIDVIPRCGNHLPPLFKINDFNDPEKPDIFTLRYNLATTKHISGWAELKASFISICYKCAKPVGVAGSKTCSKCSENKPIMTEDITIDISRCNDIRRNNDNNTADNIDTNNTINSEWYENILKRKIESDDRIFKRSKTTHDRTPLYRDFFPFATNWENWEHQNEKHALLSSVNHKNDNHVTSENGDTLYYPNGLKSKHDSSESKEKSDDSVDNLKMKQEFTERSFVLYQTAKNELNRTDNKKDNTESRVSDT